MLSCFLSFPKPGNSAFFSTSLNMHPYTSKKKKIVFASWCGLYFLRCRDHKSLRSHEALSIRVQMEVHGSHNFFNWISGPKGRIINLLLGKLWTLPPPPQAETNSSPLGPVWATRLFEPTCAHAGRELLEPAQEALASTECWRAREEGSRLTLGGRVEISCVCRPVLAAKAAPAPEKVRTPDPPKPGNSMLELKL